MSATVAIQGRILDGRYELRELIGQGTFGRVYRGHDQRLDRAVAVKVIRPEWTEDPEWVERFEREAQLMARVSSPGIGQIHDVGNDRGRLYYVAELVDGESLAARLSRGPLAPSQARDIAEQLCRALAEAHRQRVVHRDIKPANVLIDRGGRVKVADFGVARLAGADGEGGTGTVVGSPGYMAPEQARGGVPTPASDVFSVGAVLDQMLGASAPPQLTAIAERAMAAGPGDRYASAGEMAAALASVETGPSRSASTRVRRLSPRVNVNPAERRRYRILLAGVLAILAAMIAAAVLTSRSTVRAPDVHALTRAQAAAKARARGLRPSFSRRYSNAPVGTVVAERPAAGARISEGSTLGLVLSAGPPPVPVPQLMGQSTTDAQAILARLRLRASLHEVPAPGVTPGLVVAQSPAAAKGAARGSAVELSVAETPRWRPLTSFSGDGPGQSVAFKIRGDRWRVVYDMSYDGTCGFLGLFCSGPSAQIIEPSAAARTDRFGLSTGNGQTRVFNSGPGVYQISVTPGSDTAHWSIQVQDDY